jgi:hypothetical protein
MDRAWRGAEASHFWMLAHRQLYSGDAQAAMRTALNLRRFDGVLPTRGVYSLLALAALCAGFFGQCSKAFMKLENLVDASEAEREAYVELAAAIFNAHPPVVRLAAPRHCFIGSLAKRLLRARAWFLTLGVRLGICIAGTTWFVSSARDAGAKRTCRTLRTSARLAAERSLAKKVACCTASTARKTCSA